MLKTYKLKKDEKEAVGLMTIGTFLEYFDFMIYVHLAVVLNDLFFPTTDPHTAKIMSAFTFCTTFVFRPLGSLVFGYIGDSIGRKAVVVITTFMMAVSCIIMASLPTYAQIGVAASWIMILCRVIQSLSSCSEVVGAQIYLTEIIKPPLQYPLVAFLEVATVLGGFAALCVATLVMSYDTMNWRFAFWIGAFIAIVGAAARTSLKETPDFLEAKAKKDTSNDKSNDVSWKTIIALFALECVLPISFYYVYIYSADVLKQDYGYSNAEVIQHNLCISLMHVIGMSLLAYSTYKIYPMKIMKALWYCSVAVIIGVTYYLNLITTGKELFFIQVAIILLTPLEATFVLPIVYKFIPINKRFTLVGMSYSMSRVILFPLLTFGFIYVADIFGHYALAAVILPMLLFYKMGLNYFNKLLKQENPDKNT